MSELKLPKIDAGDCRLSRVTEKAWKAIKKANAPPYLFRYGNAPCRLERDDSGVLGIHHLTLDKLRYEVARAAEWFKLGDKNRTYPAKPPKDVIQDMLAAPSPPLPILERVTETPVFSSEGDLLTEPGYFPEARIYYSPPKGFSVEVPDNPMPSDIARAKRLLFERLLFDFPFVASVDRAHAIAMFLLPFARDMIEGPTPLHVLRSPTVGTGKSLLSSVLLRPAFGPRLGSIAQTRNEDEMRKRITSLLMRGAGAIIIDNVKKPLDSGALSAALTMLYWSDRILGKSAMVNLPVRCVWVATANNPEVSTDIARRSIPINLDPQCAAPWKRSNFRCPNLLAFVDKHRSNLVKAALVFIQNWLSQEKPLWKEKTLGSFEQWASVMGGILEVNGIEGFLDNLDDFYEASDTERYCWETLANRWWEKFRRKSVSAGELFSLALESGVGLTGSNEQARHVSFGVQLRNRRDQVFGQFKIIRVGQANRALLWKLEPTHLKAVKLAAGGDGDGAGHYASINPDNFEKETAKAVENDVLHEGNYSENRRGASLDPNDFEKAHAQ